MNFGRYLVDNQGLSREVSIKIIIKHNFNIEGLPVILNGMSDQYIKDWAMKIRRKKN